MCNIPDSSVVELPSFGELENAKMSRGLSSHERYASIAVDSCARLPSLRVREQADRVKC